MYNILTPVEEVQNPTSTMQTKRKRDDGEGDDNQSPPKKKEKSSLTEIMAIVMATLKAAGHV